MFNFDVLVVGAGHAGIEASISAAKLGCKVALFTLNIENIGLMPCNPAVGGPAKSNLVREIDALGGVMGRISDNTYVQLKTLNLSKGPAVRALRAQSDKILYKYTMRKLIEEEKNISLFQTQITELIIENNEIKGVTDELGVQYKGRCCILTTGTSLGGKIFIGLQSFCAGRMGERSASYLSSSLIKAGFPLKRLKTGTPARVDSRTIDYSKLQIQPPDEPDKYGCYNFFSFKKEKNIRPQIPCYLTRTNELTHKIIKENLDKSPLYSGLIHGVGPRYCPSIEDKVVRFKDNPSHHIFIEPEGMNTYETYVQGFSTSLPIDVQFKMLRSLEGLENVSVIKPAYAVEYDSVPAVELTHSLMTKKVKGLFMAGQINGTSGYEEAAAQGLIAGINACYYLQNKEMFEPERKNSYIGTLIDDLVTKDLLEPYRMLTSRSEYRLILRQDNADFRLMEKGYEIGLVKNEDIERFRFKKEAVLKEIENLKNSKISFSEKNREIMSKLNQSFDSAKNAYELIKRPDIDFLILLDMGHKKSFETDDIYLNKEIIEQVEILIKYEGYIERQKNQVEISDKLEKIKIPDNIDFMEIKQISTETKELLNKIKPKTLAQALRIGGVKPADISVLMVLIESGKLRGKIV